MPNIAIKVSHLTKVYKLYDKPIDRLKESLHPLKNQYHKDFYALSDVSFEIKKGETVGIIGKNGAGKSTLLKIITGVLTPSSGHVHVNGRIASLLELGAGFNPEYTGIENIYLQGTLMGYTQAYTDAKMEQILQFADIGEHIHQPVKTYSSGMFARLAFAISINVEPDIFIVDEALAVGDMNFQAKCMTAMDRIKQKGTTILFVSHDIGSVKSLCERGIYIKNGVLHSIGKASDVAELYIQEMRENMNQEISFSLTEQVENTNNSNVLLDNNSIAFKKSLEFEKKVSQFRYGSGEAKVTYVEVLDTQGSLVIDAEFDQEVIVRIYFECFVDTTLSVAFVLFDDKRINIAGGSFQEQGVEQICVKKDETYMVEYRLKLPLQMNTYSLQTFISNYITGEVNIAYYDVVPNAYTFNILRRKDSTLWSKVCLFPSFEIIKIQ